MSRRTVAYNFLSYSQFPRSDRRSPNAEKMSPIMMWMQMRIDTNGEDNACLTFTALFSSELLSRARFFNLPPYQFVGSSIFLRLPRGKYLMHSHLPPVLIPFHSRASRSSRLGVGSSLLTVTSPIFAIFCDCKFVVILVAECQDFFVNCCPSYLR